jgi:hypothetical protein
METFDFSAGGYRFIKGGFPFSAGVAALPGHRIVRVRFKSPVPLAEGFRRIESTLSAAGRPVTALCACELRSPEPFSEDGFKGFNKIYVARLADWGIFDGERNPVARSNVCPSIAPPQESAFHAFSFTVTDGAAAPSFVISGGAEAAEGHASYRERIIRLGDVSAEGLREKALFVLTQMERRMQALGFRWSDTTATQVYTVYDLHPFFADEIVRRGAAPAGLTWHFNRPPVTGLDYEMDCRGVMDERVTV